MRPLPPRPNSMRAWLTPNGTFLCGEQQFASLCGAVEAELVGAGWASRKPASRGVARAEGDHRSKFIALWSAFQRFYAIVSVTREMPEMVKMLCSGKLSTSTFSKLIVLHYLHTCRHMAMQQHAFRSGIDFA